MNNKEYVKELKATLKSLYGQFGHRIIPELWYELLTKSMKIDEMKTNVIVIDFLKDEKYLPERVWRTIGTTLKWTNFPAELRDFYTEVDIHRLLSKMNTPDLIRYELFPDKLSQRCDEYFMYGEHARKYLDHNQLYLASLCIERAKKIYNGHPDLTLLEAELYIQKFEYQRADNLLGLILSAEPNNGMAYMWRGVILRNKGFYERALESFHAAEAAGANPMKLNLEKAECLLHLEMYQKARACYSACLAKEPYNRKIQELMYQLNQREIRQITGDFGLIGEGKKRLIEAYLYSGMRADALNAGSEIEKAFYKTVEGCLLAGHIKVLGGKYQAATEAYNKCQEIDLDETRGLLCLGKVKTAQRQYQEGISLFEKVISLAPKTYEAYKPLADMYLARNEDDKADILAESMISYGADLANMYVVKGRVLEEKGLNEDAIFYYNWAIKIDPVSAEAYERKIALLEKLGYKEEAAIVSVPMSDMDLKAWPVLVRLPEYEEKPPLKAAERAEYAIISQANDILRTGKIVEAYFNLKKAAEALKGKTYLSQFRMGQILYLMNRQSEAKEILVKYLKDPELGKIAADLVEDINAELSMQPMYEIGGFLKLADAYYESGRIDECFELLKQHEGRRGFTPEALVLLGKCYINKKNIRAAINCFEKGLEADPKLKGAQALSAMCLQVLGKKEEALKAYNEAILMEDDVDLMLVRKADLLVSMERWKDIYSMFRGLSLEQQKNPDLQGYAGIAKYHLGDVIKAKEYLEYAFANGTENGEFYALRSEIYNNQGNPYSGLSCAEKGLSIDPACVSLYHQKAECLFALGRFRAAARMNRVSMDMDMSRPEPHFLLGRIYANRNLYKEAIECYEKALSLDKNNKKYMMAIAKAAENDRDFEKAADCYGKMMEVSPEDVDILIKRAGLYHAMEMDEKALLDLKLCLDKEPENARCYKAIGDVLLNYEPVEVSNEQIEGELRGDHNEAFDNTSFTNEKAAPDPDQSLDTLEESSFKSEKDLEKGDNLVRDEEPSLEAGPDSKVESLDSVQTDSDDIPSSPIEENDHQAEEHTETDNPQDQEATVDVFAYFNEDSEYYYTKAIELDPLYLECYMSRGVYRAQGGKFRSALADFTAVLTLDSSNMEGLLNRGTVYMVIGDTLSAVEDFKKILELDEDNIPSYNNLVECYNILGDYGEAAKYAELGLKKDPENLYIIANRGITFYQVHKYEQATEDLSKVIRQKNRISTAMVESCYKYRGLSYDKMGEEDKALEDFRQYILYNPDNEEINTRYRSLKKRDRSPSNSQRRVGFFRKK